MRDEPRAFQSKTFPKVFSRVQSSDSPITHTAAGTRRNTTMRLYKVHIEYETVILADSAESAMEEARYGIRNEIDDQPEAILVDEILKSDDLPAGWNLQCRPWGMKDPKDRTIGQILRSQNRKAMSMASNGNAAAERVANLKS